MLSRQIENPRRDGAIKVALQPGGERNQFSRVRRTAGGNEMRDAFGGEQVRLAVLDALDPGFDRFVILQRDTPGKFLVTGV